MRRVTISQTLLEAVRYLMFIDDIANPVPNSCGNRNLSPPISQPLCCFLNRNPYRQRERNRNSDIATKDNLFTRGSLIKDLCNVSASVAWKNQCLIFFRVFGLCRWYTRLSGLLGIQSVLFSLVHFNQLESLLAEELFPRELA
ncbi:hypothetical protein TSUD_208030 [Trifolium subterraneum]|uniref:Uncharacterized protein n=1 Tax=Trifolium subterraneum TaxID=3900 RepID=A0A2Z6MTL3_TRISU|nr:hypothetical protein TSUD_208030 [Trifolium subterraneum]